MNINQNQMKEINKVQLEMFKEFINVCDKLNLKYYAVHGTLLGALKHNGFFPMDDDIDVAMPRKDYDCFISKAQSLLSDELFIQSTKTDAEYPLVFAKIRNSNTTYIPNNMNDLKINKGIYIDIFPIDDYPNNHIQQFFCNLKNKIYSIRISTRITSNKISVVQHVKRIVSIIICPSWNKARIKNEKLYSKITNSKKCIVYGGKRSEINIDKELFENRDNMIFEGLNICVPVLYKEYLKIIYNDYESYDPSKQYTNSDGTVQISATIVDVNKPYTYYEEIGENNEKTK